MITDLFPPERLTLALAVYSLGASAGAGCAFLLGGLLIEQVSQQASIVLPLIGEVRSWQAVFYIIGLPGIALSLLAFTLSEPRRRGVRQTGAGKSLAQNVFSGYPELIRFIRSRGRFFLCHYGGFGLASLGFTGGQAWYAAHMARSFGWSPAEVGTGIGVAMVIGGFGGKFTCGLGVNTLYRRGYKDAQFRWFAGCLAVATPIAVFANLSGIPWVFVAGICMFMFLLSPITATYVSSLNLVTPNELRGAGVAFFSATVGLIALSLGPFAIAAFSEYLYGGTAIGKGIATLVAMACPAAGVLLWWGRDAMHDAVLQSEAWQ